MADSRINASYTVTDASGKKSTKSLTDLSPSASGAQIKNLVAGLVSLTTNTLSQIDRVETTDIMNATDKPKFTVNPNTESIEAISFGQKTNSKPLFYGVTGDKPQLSVEFHFEKADGTIVNLVAPTIVFAANWTDSTNNVNAFSDTTGASAFELTKLIADLHFAETDSTLATTYRLTIANGETTTFEQL